MLRKICRPALAFLLILGLSLGLAAPAAALSESQLHSAAAKSAEYVLKTVTNPQVGSVGGEWAIIGLARCGYPAPEEYYRAYLAQVEKYVAACEGALHAKKYTEYSRLILALAALGQDPTNVGGYNLLIPLGDFDKTVWQGVNGPIWALLALDAGSYPMPLNPAAQTQATRQMYVDEILRRQLPEGGWNLGAAGDADPDVTAMALQALAGYQSQEKVRAAIEAALTCLSRMQNREGGFTLSGAATVESTAQVIIALGQLGLSLEDSRFVKNGRTLADDLLSYMNEEGGFRHVAAGSGVNQMATEQGLCGLAAALRNVTGKNSLYNMADAVSLGPGPGQGQGLPGKHRDVLVPPISAPDIDFIDIAQSPNKAAIRALAARGIINGMGNGRFAPEATLTRAQFAAIISRGLGLTTEDTGVFSDVGPERWYAGYVGGAHKYGLINGVGNGRFNPEGTLTRQEAAVMVARAARLCGMETAMEAGEIRDALAQFSDYTTISPWAQEGLAFCYSVDILDQNDLTVEPRTLILRGEMAQMVYNLLIAADLI